MSLISSEDIIEISSNSDNDHDVKLEERDQIELSSDEEVSVVEGKRKRAGTLAGGRNARRRVD